MVQYSAGRLDRVFSALADPTRRAVLETLGRGGFPVSSLAEPHDMSLPGFMKHLRVLEQAGLIACTKEGRVVSCELAAAPMREAAAWLGRYEEFWTERLDSLGRYLAEEEEKQSWKQQKLQRDRRSRSHASTPPRRRKSGGRGPTRKR